MQRMPCAHDDAADDIAIDLIAALDVAARIDRQQRPFQRADRIEQRDLCRRARQPMAALWPAHALDQAGAPQQPG